MHAHEDRSSHGEAHSDRADDGEHSRHGRPSARELDLWRLTEITAYVCVDDLSETQEESSAPEDDVSPEAKRKRKQRQKDEAAGEHQFNVKMPKDDPVLKETIKRVAAALGEIANSIAPQMPSYRIRRSARLSTAPRRRQQTQP